MDLVRAAFEDLSAPVAPYFGSLTGLWIFQLSPTAKMASGMAGISRLCNFSLQHQKSPDGNLHLDPSGILHWMDFFVFLVLVVSAVWIVLCGASGKEWPCQIGARSADRAKMAIDRTGGWRLAR